jgi:hypothetical protein
MLTAMKLLMLAATALAALALSATTATAQVTVEDEATESLCPVVTGGPSGPIAGGCHVEFESEEDVFLLAHIPGVGELPQLNCEVFFEARIGPDGEGYVTEAILNPPHDSSLGGCTREPCMTGDAIDPWPIHITEDEPSNEEATITFCLSPIGQMGTKTPCTLDLPLNQDGHHQEITASNSNRCEQQPIVSLVGHFVSHEGNDEIVIHHN